MLENISLKNWNFEIQELNYKKEVIIPHTWNVDSQVMKHRGNARYTTEVELPLGYQSRKISLYFGAVYHTALIYVNHEFVMRHSGSGFTPFSADITSFVKLGAVNTICVHVNNSYIEEMLPHADHFDWADDGGLIRKVELHISNPNNIDSIQVGSRIDTISNRLGTGSLLLYKNQYISNGNPVSVTVSNALTKEIILTKILEFENSIEEISFENLNLWDVDAPNLYLVQIQEGAEILHRRIGLRTIEVNGKGIYLNGKEIYLKGCEWMPGSHPDYGMAEPLEHSIFRLKQLKNSGCVFTRFHWQQDSSLYDWCDENGLLVQEEIPYWGYPKTASSLQLEVAKMQANEMIAAHFHHPSIVFWGVGNELGGAEPATIRYVEDMYHYFKEKDGTRLVNYVSNSLSLPENSKNDDATLHADIAMWNEYLGLWEPCEDIRGRIETTLLKCKGKPLIITEFGLCEPHFKGGDEKRAELLASRITIYKQFPQINGYVWFSLNDYRTCMGEEGEDKFRQRIHGSTDLYGQEKPSYKLLCEINNVINRY